jgi:hypothetical protein
MNFTFLLVVHPYPLMSSTNAEVVPEQANACTMKLIHTTKRNALCLEYLQTEHLCRTLTTFVKVISLSFFQC